MNLKAVKRVTVTFCCLIVILLISSACSKRPTAPGTWYIGNNQTKLSDYRGKVVLLDFYATWCEPCRAETPRLVQLQNDYGASGLQVIGLNVGGDDDREKVPAFAKEFGIEYPLGFPDDYLVDQYLTDNQDIPQAFVFDRNGDLVKRFIGYSSSSGAELERIVKGALTSGPVAQQTK
ncbi:MAG TPA: TlpA disulfide reductase family protein [Pyrinomonadaceae bacterium]|jgi:thiol-disulfide isomerase/thioredoxin|nr:TlpA disulfide reductase family protein [Pyrinomonadaceae bacterium]